MLTFLPGGIGTNIVDAIEQDRYSVLVGSDAKFMSRLNPKAAAGFIYKQMTSLLPA